MDDSLQQLLKIPASRLEAINALLLDPDAQVGQDSLAVVAKYGSPEEINRKARAARELPQLLRKAKETQPASTKELEWLQAKARGGGFEKVGHYRRWGA